MGGKKKTTLDSFPRGQHFFSPAEEPFDDGAPLAQAAILARDGRFDLPRGDVKDGRTCASHDALAGGFFVSLRVVLRPRNAQRHRFVARFVARNKSATKAARRVLFSLRCAPPKGVRATKRNKTKSGVRGRGEKITQPVTMVDKPPDSIAPFAEKPSTLAQGAFSATSWLSGRPWL